MSGGHWNYTQYQISNGLGEISDDGQVIRRFPKLAQVFREMSIILADRLHTLDWDLSGDNSIQDDQKFEVLVLEQLSRALSRKFKYRIYEIENGEPWP